MSKIILEEIIKTHNRLLDLREIQCDSDKASIDDLLEQQKLTFISISKRLFNDKSCETEFNFSVNYVLKVFDLLEHSK
jgi:hypothetical protein